MLGQLVREWRQAHGYSLRGFARRAALNYATVVRLERGHILTPQADTLAALASAMDRPVSDLFAVTGWLPAQELPTLRPYLRTKYRDLPTSELIKLEHDIDDLIEKYGIDGSGPRDGEDER